LQRNDGRWEVRCPQCALSPAEITPVGIELPIVNRVEAEWIMRNHAGGVQATPRSHEFEHHQAAGLKLSVEPLPRFALKQGVAEPRTGQSRLR
jgi:hypothetical protein